MAHPARVYPDIVRSNGEDTFRALEPELVDNVVRERVRGTLRHADHHPGTNDRTVPRTELINMRRLLTF